MSHQGPFDNANTRDGLGSGPGEHIQHTTVPRSQQQYHHPSLLSPDPLLHNDDDDYEEDLHISSRSSGIQISLGRPTQQYSQLESNPYEGTPSGFHTGAPIAGAPAGAARGVDGAGDYDLGTGHVPYDNQYHNRNAEAYPLHELNPDSTKKPKMGMDGMQQDGAMDSTARLNNWGYQIPGWPTSPMLLQQSKAKRIFYFISQLIFSLTPLFFIVQCFLALRLNGKRVDENRWGQNILIISGTYGVSIFPILFAILCGSAMIAIANYMLEKGSSLLLLEQFMGSDTVARTVKTQWSLQAWNWRAFALIWLWSLSPLGGQGSLRLIKTGYSTHPSSAQVTYLNTSILSAAANSAFSSGSGLSSSRSAVNTLFTASVVSPDQTLYASVDLWGNVKIPRFQDFAKEDNRGWVQVPVNSSFFSLIGLPVLKIPARANSTFNVTTQQFQFSCTQPAEIAVELLQQLKFVNNYSFTTTNISDPGGTFSVQLWPRTTNNSITLNNTFSPPFTEPRVLAVLQRVDGKYNLANCSTFFPAFQSIVKCSSQTSCNITTMRNVTESWSTLLGSPLDTVPVGYNSLLSLATAWGPTLHSGISSPSEIFLATGQSPIVGSAFSEEVDLSTVSAVNFTQRFTTIFNTYYDAGRVPFVQSNPILQSRSSYLDLQRIGFTGINATTSTTTSDLIYITDSRWLIILLISSVVLMGISAYGVFLKFSMAGHQMLTNVSLLTLSNPYVPLPFGGSALNGYDRTRLLSDLILKMGDVRPREDVGQIAIATVSNGQEVGNLNKRRLYF